MDAVKLMIPVDLTASKLMGSDVLVGARVCSTDAETRESDVVLPFSSSNSKIDDCSSLLAHRGSIAASGPSSWLKKTDAELYRSNYFQSRSGTEDASLMLVDGMSSGSTMISDYEGKQIQRKIGKTPRNGNNSFRKPPRMLQSDNMLPPQAEADDAKAEVDKLGLHLMKCSNADKTQAAKQKNNINGRRGDRRNSKVPMKAKCDPFSQKVGLPNFSPASGGGNVFGMYGLKPDVNDVAKHMDDISLDELLDGTYKSPNLVKDKGKKAAIATENILDSVKKACSVIRVLGIQQAKQAEEVDSQVNKQILLPSSPSNTSEANGCDADETSVSVALSKCGKDLESSLKAESPAEKDKPLCQPKDILERLALTPAKDLDSLLQDAVKPVVSSKHHDLRNGKTLSHRVSLPPFPWSQNFNGHYKSNNDALRLSNRSTCHGRWVRIRSNACSIGGGKEDFAELDSLTYDNSLVPAGQLMYKLPETESSSSVIINQQRCQQSSSAVCPTTSLSPSESGSNVHSKVNALPSPRVVAAAQTLCDIAADWSNRLSNGILKWPKQPSQKAMKARKSRSSDKPDEFLMPKSEALLDHVVKSIEYGSSSKKSKISVVERREDFGHIHAVIGLSSVSAPRSNRTSPSRLSRDSVVEARNLNGGYVKPQFMAPLPPAPPRLLDNRSNHNSQKVRKVSPMDWNRTRN